MALLRLPGASCLSLRSRGTHPHRNTRSSLRVHCSDYKPLIVVRVAASQQRSYGHGSPLLSASAALSGPKPTQLDLPPMPTVETVNASPADFRDLARDPAVLHVTRPMPICLIGPEATPDTNTNTTPPPPGPTWGISAIGADRSNFDGTGVKVCTRRGKL